MLTDLTLSFMRLWMCCNNNGRNTSGARTRFLEEFTSRRTLAILGLQKEHETRVATCWIESSADLMRAEYKLLIDKLQKQVKDVEAMSSDSICELNFAIDYPMLPNPRSLSQ